MNTTTWKPTAPLAWAHPETLTDAELAEGLAHAEARRGRLWAGRAARFAAELARR